MVILIITQILINSEIKDNTIKLNEIDNSGIIPKNYNTKDPLKNTNATLDINKIIDVNNDSYTDSVKSTCIDNIKSTNANNNYSSFIKTFCEGIRKSARNEIIKDAIYADSIKSTCIDNIKSTNYIDIIKSTCNDTIKNNFTYADSAKSACQDEIKSTIVNINYIDSTKSTCTDNVKSVNIKINKQKSNITWVYCNNINNKSAHSKINYELNALLKIKKVSNTNIIIKKKLQAINIKYELSMLINLKRLLMLLKMLLLF